MSELAALRVSRPGRPAAAPPETPVGQPQGSVVLAALRSIVDYIPTEVVTIYVAVVAALSDSGSPSRTGQWVAFWVFLALTPAALWALQAARLRAGDSGPPTQPHRWPWPEAIVATIGFILWAFTLPGTPFTDYGWYRPGLGTAVLLVGTLVLGLGAPLFTRASAPARA